MRFHGAGTKYSGCYGDEQLCDWAGCLALQIAGGYPVFAYFNNDWGGRAPRDAVRLRGELERTAGGLRAFRSR